MDPFSGSINIISKQIKCYRSAQPFSGCSSTRWKITDEEGLGAALSVRVIQRNNDVWLRADYYNYIIFFFKQTWIWSGGESWAKSRTCSCCHCVEMILRWEKITVALKEKVFPSTEFLYRKMNVLGCRHALVSEMWFIYTMAHRGGG